MSADAIRDNYAAIIDGTFLPLIRVRTDARRARKDRLRRKFTVLHLGQIDEKLSRPIALMEEDVRSLISGRTLHSILGSATSWNRRPCWALPRICGIDRDHAMWLRGLGGAGLDALALACRRIGVPPAVDPTQSERLPFRESQIGH